MTPRERAIRIGHKAIAEHFSLPLFEQMVNDDSKAGKNARELVDTIEQGIVADRREQQSLRAPS